MLLCPNCNHSLTPLTFNTQAHGKLEIEHCYYCGGVWFEHFDINRLPLHEAIYLSRMATKEDLAKIQSSNKCPRDQSQLHELRSESIPLDITVFSCPTCMGNFVSKTALVPLKKAQKIKIDYFKTWRLPLPAISAVLIPGLLIFTLTAGVFLTVQTVRKSQEARIKAQELIGEPTIVVSERNTVLVSFTTSVPALATITYQGSVDKELHTVPVSLEKQKTHLVTLPNLTAKTTYTLKIYVEEIPGQIISSPTYTFRIN